jgi:CheY-like chemotaxis protein
MASILVVDDSAVDRRLAGGLLEKGTYLEVRYAENGQMALKEIDREPPDVVVTDLQMPEMDGLQLVLKIAQDNPDIPVVLMTAHGSESIAAQALANGAASYVAKTDLAESLVNTVMLILAMNETDLRYRRLIQCSTRTQFEFMLDNDPQLIEPLNDLVQQVVASMNVCDTSQRVRLGVALENALTNAMIRGNLEIAPTANQILDRELVSQRRTQKPYKERRVYVNVAIDRDKVEFLVRDQGPGFDISQIPQSGDPAAFKNASRRGLVLIKTFMDDVKFDSKGNEVRMVKFFGGRPH